jgi:hypothetical protein
MNLDIIKQKLDSLNKQSSNSQGGERKQLFWKPSVGKQVIRVVPSKFNKEFPFTEMKFYYGIGKKVMASPTNWGEKDPIVEYVKLLRDSSDRDNWRLAKKLEAKTRVFAPVVIRGEEAEGVKLWQFGKEVYDAFLNMAYDEEIGDYTDIVNGRDIKLTTVGPESTGTPYNKTTIGPSLKTSPLSDSQDTVAELLDNQVDPMKIFKPLSYDEMKNALQEWLTPEGESEGSISSEPAVGFDDEKKEEKKSNYSLKTKSKSEQFDNMFNDNKEDDGLPF